MRAEHAYVDTACAADRPVPGRSSARPVDVLPEMQLDLCLVMRPAAPAIGETVGRQAAKPAGHEQPSYGDRHRGKHWA